MSRLATIALACLALACLSLPATAAAKKPPASFYGVVPQESPSGGDYANMGQGGVGVMRIPFYWTTAQLVPGKCEPEPQIATCNWDLFDQLVGNAASVGVRVLPTLTGTPPFVSKKYPNKAPTGGKDLRRWKAFVKAAAKRYGRGGIFWQSYEGYGGNAIPITDWQVWNEPNAKQFWHPAPNPGKYAKLVKETAKSLRKGDRKAGIVLGGMFAGAKIPIVSFMRQFYRSKRIGRYFDELAIHPYSPTIKGLKRQLGAARKAARGKTGIRVTELGWSSKKGKHPLMKGPKGQAKMLGKAFRLLAKRHHRWHITGVNWFALRDTDRRDTCDFCRDSGLFGVGGNPKPAWREFMQVAG